MKKWTELSKLDCVKKLGFNHKVAHFFGIHMVSLCLMDFGEEIGEKIEGGDGHR